MRYSVTFKRTAARTVERLADEAGVSVAEIVRLAVAREAWFREIQATGGVLMVQRDEVLHEVEFV